MSVRTTLFLLLASLLLALIATQWWLTQRQSAVLGEALARTTFQVSSDTVSVLIFGEHGEGGPLASDQVFDMALSPEGDDGVIVLSGADWSQRVAIPRDGLEQALRNWHRRQFEATAIVMLFALAGAGLLAIGFARPLRRLQQASSQVASGELGIEIEAGRHAPDELRETVTAFNTMSRALAKLEADNRALRAHEAADELSDLARGLAHTLRNPLNTLGLTLDEMARSDLETQRRDQLALLARRQIVQIDRWLRALLDVTQQDAQPPLRLDCGQLVRDTVQEFSDRGIALHIEAPPQGPFVLGHAREIASLLHTLLGNAIEASTPGQSVTIQLSGDDDAVTIAVRDHGAGLASGVRERLFQPHVTTKSHGAGMGLFLARRIARGRYRGDVVLHDNPENQSGTTAILTLHSRSPA